jgi:hypothetical protein
MTENQPDMTKCIICNDPAEHKKFDKPLCTYHWDLANDHKRGRG